MPQLHKTKTERMHVRLESRTKHRIERAAALTHRTISDFAVKAMTSEAERVLNEHERTTLSDRERDTFLLALANPPRLNSSMQSALKEWHRLNE